MPTSNVERWLSNGGGSLIRRGRTNRDVTPPPYPVPLTGAKPIGTGGPAIPFPIPSNYKFVSDATGSDTTGDGSQGSPWKTFAKANSSAPNGSVVVLKGASYHERFVIGSTKVLTIQAAPGETVWFDGSSVYSSWSGSGPWTTSYTMKLNQSSTTPGTRNAAPYNTWSAGSLEGDNREKPDQVFYDGTAMTQIADGSTPGAMQFSVNLSANTLTIGSNPSGHEVRISDLKEAVVSGPVNVYGIGFRRFTANNINGSGTDGWSVLYLASNAYNCVFEDCWFMDNAYVAINAIRPVTVNRCTAMRHGMTPFFIEKATDGVLDGIFVDQFNLNRWNAEPVAAAIKVARSDGIEIRNCRIRNGSGSYGIWLDVNCSRYQIINNDIDGYSSIGNDMERGIETEISGGGLMGGVQYKGIIANNRVANCEVGYMCFNSDWNLIYNNDFRLNDVGVMIWTDTRASRDTYRTVGELPWVSENNYLFNNMFENGGQTTLYAAMIDCEDHRASPVAGSVLFPVLASGNWFHSSGDVAELNNAGSSARTTYANITTLAAAVGAKMGANVEDTVKPANSTAIGLPADVAAAIGVPTGAQVVGPILSAPVVQT